MADASATGGSPVGNLFKEHQQCLLEDSLRLFVIEELLGRFSGHFGQKTLKLLLNKSTFRQP
jgi:hypothetical protein